MLGRLRLGDLLDLRRCGTVNFGGRPPRYLGYSEPNPSALKLRITSRTRSSLVKATFAMAATSMPWADSGTICARRQVTTDPTARALAAFLAGVDLAAYRVIQEALTTSGRRRRSARSAR
jgi:hypothetical protein